MMRTGCGSSQLDSLPPPDESLPDGALRERDQLPVLLQRVPSDEQLRAQDMVDVIEFLAATGCRVGEACGLQWDAVDLDAGTTTIRANA
ncbi:tyrosine-type recombinase/integrase, partial [Amnibacterium sp.]|uniref:tyrosine-type recombinase/integrase n=1 Tax=Amnibacterium sp. TaxID=1872496 RepID=UPI002A1DAD58|nr:site-specific integrase [Amnibacterium sp.]